MSFGQRLEAAFSAYGQLCVGVDPHAGLLAEWQLPDSAEGVRDFGLRVVEAAAGRVGIIKPQVAFFERHGSAGLLALEQVLEAARQTDLVVIGDAKRGDIGSTMDGYAAAWLDEASPLAVDAVTASGYLGAGSLDGAARAAAVAGKGLFVLAATSNPEASELQLSRDASGRTVAAGIVDHVRGWNSDADSMGHCGVVIGATVSLSDYGITAESLRGVPILAPGFGFQGASLGDVRALFGHAAPSVIMSVSRSVLAAGPADLASAIDASALEAREALAL